MLVYLDFPFDDLAAMLWCHSTASKLCQRLINARGHTTRDHEQESEAWFYYDSALLRRVTEYADQCHRLVRNDAPHRSRM